MNDPMQELIRAAEALLMAEQRHAETRHRSLSQMTRDDFEDSMARSEALTVAFNDLEATLAAAKAELQRQRDLADDAGEPAAKAAPDPRPLEPGSLIDRIDQDGVEWTRTDRVRAMLAAPAPRGDAEALAAAHHGQWDWECTYDDPDVIPKIIEAVDDLDTRLREFLRERDETREKLAAAEDVIADRGIPERDCTAALPDRIDAIIVEMKNARHDYGTVCLENEKLTEERDEAREKLAAAEDEFNLLKTCIEQNHNGYHPDARAVMPSLKKPESHRAALLDLIGEGAALADLDLHEKLVAATNAADARQVVLDAIADVLADDGFTGPLQERVGSALMEIKSTREKLADLERDLASFRETHTRILDALGCPNLFAGDETLVGEILRLKARVAELEAR